MKCPKCKKEIKDDSVFCINCGTKIKEVSKEVKEKNESNEEKKTEPKKEENTTLKEDKKTEVKVEKIEETPKKKKADEDKKKLNEIRKQEKIKLEEQIKEAEKQEAIRQAKQEGIELEIIDKKPEEEPEKKETPKKNVKVKEEKPKKEKKKKIKIKKNIFQRMFNKLLFMIIVAAIIIGGIYYCYRQELLPEFVQEQVQDFDFKLQNVINTYKDLKNDDNSNPAEVEEKEEWKVEPSIEADNIEELDEDVSVIVKDNKYGIIDNETGEILLEEKYSNIFYGEYTNKEDATEKGIIVKDSDKYYTVDSEYKIDDEVKISEDENEVSYYYDHHSDKIYETDSDLNAAEFKKVTKKELKVCTDIDIVTTEGEEARSTDLPEKFTIDPDNSTETTKGYFNTSTGKLVINCDYDKAYEFNEKYAAVKIDNKAGYIDESGEKVIELKYEETRNLHNGLAFVKKDGKWGILKIK